MSKFVGADVAGAMRKIAEVGLVSNRSAKFLLGLQCARKLCAGKVSLRAFLSSR